MNVATGGTLVQDLRMDVYGKTTFEDTIALGPEQWHTNPYRGLFPSRQAHELQLPQPPARRPERLRQGDGLQVGGPPAHPERPSPGPRNGWGKASWPRPARATDGSSRPSSTRSIKRVLGVQFHPEHPVLWDAEPRFARSRATRGRACWPSSRARRRASPSTRRSGAGSRHGSSRATDLDYFLLE